MGGVLPALTGTGQTLYAALMNMADGAMWNGASREPFNPARWGNYAVAMSEQSGSGRYLLSIPVGLPAGDYWVTPYIQNGGAPSLSGDTPLDILRLGWDGTNIVDFGSGINVVRINGSALAAANLAVSAGTFVIGAAVAGALTATQMTTNLPGTVANMYSGRVLLFTTGVNAGIAVLITAYVVAGGQLTFIAYNNQVLATPPSIGDTFVIF